MDGRQGKDSVFHLRPGGVGMAYEWDHGIARRARLTKLVGILALTGTAISLSIILVILSLPT